MKRKAMVEGENWAEWELGKAKLGDKRRTKRAVAIVRARAAQPMGGLTQSLGEWAEAKAGYRFYENDEVEAEALMGAHAERVKDRVKEGADGRVFAIQDTTHIVSGEQDVWAHTMMVVNERREVHGLIHQQVWARSATQPSVQTDHHTRKVEEKESHKWIAGIAAAGRFQMAVGKTEVVCMGDREDDIFEAFVAAGEQSVKLLIRAAQDRRICEARTRLWPYLTDQPRRGQITVEVGRKGERPPRQACLNVHMARVSLRPPQHRPLDERVPISVGAVYLVEPNPPTGDEPIEWMLLTTLPIDTFEQACQCARWYALRWLIELFHKILKSGCRIEQRQFQDLSNFTRYLTLDSIVAWRILFLTLIGRSHPDLPCSIILETHEWQALFAHHHPKQRIPKSPPRLADAVTWIAKLGGFLARKSDGQPGIIVLWRGLQRLHDIALGFQAAQLVGKA